MNQLFLVGRLTKEVELMEGGKGIITLAVNRPFKNEEGIYEVDFVDILINGNIATNTAEYCKKGDLVAVKGRIQTRIEENDDKKEKITEIVAEKISFLSSTKKD